MTSQQPNPPPTRSYPPKEKKTLKREIKRIWEWVIFFWHNSKRVGGIKEITSTLAGSAILLVQRSWRQWQSQRKLKR